MAGKRKPKPETTDDSVTLPGLNDRQSLFVYHYLETMNATRAAITAGYSEKTARVQASALLTNLNIQKAVDVLLAKKVMSANELLSRIADEARGDLGDFIGLDENELKKHPQSRLLKKYKRTISTDENGATEERVEIELYDAQAAKVHLGRYHKLWVDRVQNDDWRTEAIERIKAGDIVYSALVSELGNDLATELFKSAGVPVAHEREDTSGARG